MKIFAISDVHSAYTIMKNTLEKAGFEINNPDHMLIVCGDCFDRMDESQQLLDYLMSITNKVLIKGNHEQLFAELVQRGYPLSHDWSNCTAKTLMNLAPYAKDWNDICSVAMKKVRPLFDQMVNYFETEHYVFVHSWIPVNCDDGLPAYYRHNCKFSKKEDWRFAHQKEWDDAMWHNPLDMAMHGFGIEKTIVAGHWHCSYGHHLDSIKTDNLIPEFGEGACFDPYYYEDKLIMIDRCTAHTGEVNVLVLEDNFLEE